MDKNDIPAIEKLFRDSGVDALFFPHANFGQEESVAKIALDMKLPVLLWGPRDEAPPPKGALNRQTDIQCGLFATSKALSRYGVPFTYIENCSLDSPVLDREIESFTRVASSLKACKGLRILQLSTRPWQFLSVMVNESQLLEKFGIQTIPIESSEIIKVINNILANNNDGINALISEWKKTFSFDEATVPVLKKMAAIELGVIEMAEKYDCRAVSSECWDFFQANFGINRPCFIWGDLANKGLTVSCENDIHGSISQVILNAITRGKAPVFLADITIRHPENDNAELLWHCGPFPVSIAKEGAAKEVINCHGSWEIKGGDVTLARFDQIKDKYYLFADECKGVDGPWTDGNYLWIETKDWIKWEKKFIYGPYVHHIAGAHGCYKKELAELCYYLGNVEHDDADLPTKR
jgi:L-fucose isomerase-like protein